MDFRSHDASSERAGWSIDDSQRHASAREPLGTRVRLGYSAREGSRRPLGAHRARETALEPAAADQHREVDLAFAKYRSTRSVEAASFVYQRSVGCLRLVAASLLGDPNDVDEVVQESFAVALLRPESFDGTRNVLPWLCGIVRHRALHLRRTARRRLAREARVAGRGSTTEDAIAAVSAAELVREVEERIAGLPRTYREVVARSVLGGDGSAEIARALGRSESTVRVQLSRGLRMLRRALPAGVGAALALALLPGSGFAAIARQAGLRSGPAAPIPRHAAWRPFALAAAALLPCLALVAVWSREPDAPAAEPAPVLAAVPPAPVAERDAAVLPLRTPIASEASEPAARPGLVVALEHEGAPLADTDVSIERVHSGLFVTNVKDRFGEYPIFELPALRTRETLTARTDAKGQASFQPRPGRYVISMPGYAWGVIVESDTKGFVSFDLTSRAARIAGQVIDEHGKPCTAELWVSADRDNSILARAQVADAGRFAMLVPRGARILARTALRSSAARLVESSGEFTLQLVPAGSVRGVLRGEDGRGVAHGLVDVAAGDSIARIAAAADGTWQLNGVTAGPCVVSARAPGSGLARTDCVVRGGETGATDLTLPRGASIVGRVLGRDGRGIGKTRVSCGWSYSDLDWSATVTDDEGRFRLDGVGPGTVRLTAGLGLDGLARASFETIPGQTLVWEPQLSREDIQIRGELVVAAEAGGFVLALESVDHLAPVTQRLASGPFAFDVPEPTSSRSFTLRVYQAAAFDELGVTGCLPIATFAGLRPGAAARPFVVAADPAPAGVLSARLDASRGEYRGRVRLRHVDLDHWIEIGRLDGEHRALEVLLERLPAGRYAILLDHPLAKHEFQLARGERLELGTLCLPFQDPRSGDRTDALRELALVFEHPNDATPMGRLHGEVRSLDGRLLHQFSVPGGLGRWHANAALATGIVRVIATSDDGLAADVELTVGDEPRSSARIRLRSALAAR
jgi:RNA polymerase sigma factor (sigma-70 family)